MSSPTHNISPEKPGLMSRLNRWIKDEPAVGLDVHDGRITAAHFIERKGELVLHGLATQAYDPALTDKELAHCLHAFWKKNKLPTRSVCTSLYASSLIVRHFSYTNIHKDELPHVLALDAEEILQRPIEEIALSWHIHPHTESKKEISGVLVAAPRQTVKDHVRLIKSAGLYPVNVEIGGSAVVNLYDCLNTEPASAPVCLVNLTAQMASIVIFSGEEAYPRIVFSGKQTDWMKNLNYLVENIESALLHYQLKIKGEPVSQLFLADHPRQNRFADRFSAAISLPVETWNPFAEGKLSEFTPSKRIISPSEAGGLNLTTALGLGLRYPKGEL